MSDNKIIIYTYGTIDSHIALAVVSKISDLELDGAATFTQNDGRIIVVGMFPNANKKSIRFNVYYKDEV
jgi:hypothetical protein